MLLRYLSLLPVVEADLFLLLHFHFHVCLCRETLSSCYNWHWCTLYCWSQWIYIGWPDPSSSPLLNDLCPLIPLQICLSFAAAVCNQFALFLLSYTTNEYADSTVLGDWQFSDSQDHVSSVMNHVAPVQANLNPINAELFASLVGKASLVYNHMTHSRICYTVV